MLSEFLLRTRIKYVAVSIFGLFCVILFLSMLDHRAEEEALGVIQYKQSKVNKEWQARKKAATAEPEPVDFRVQFISGKEIAHEVDNENKAFQVHTIRLTNMEKSKVTVDCEDPFSDFGKAIPPGGFYEFRVTDLFSKRHYWCTARFGGIHYMFRAYGEGAPRDNNLVSLHKEGAFINGKIMNIEDSPMKNKLPKVPSVREREKYPAPVPGSVSVEMEVDKEEDQERVQRHPRLRREVLNSKEFALGKKGKSGYEGSVLL